MKQELNYMFRNKSIRKSINNVRESSTKIDLQDKDSNLLNTCIR
jgi:hypothetical protein